MGDRQYLMIYGNHARRAASSDRYGHIKLPQFLTLNSDEVFEVTLDKRLRVDKMVIRTSLDEKRDIIYVVIPRSGSEFFVKTVWINLRNDPHKTLQTDKYEQ